MLFKKFPACLALFMFFVSACSTSTSLVVKAVPGEQSVTAKSGIAFSVQLQSQMSTGFSWELAEVPASLLIVKENVLTEEKDKAGGIDIQEFIFKSEKKGDLNLIFRYGEHWKNKPKYIKTSTVKVKIE